MRIGLFEVSVIDKFPCPEGYHEIENLEDLEVLTENYNGEIFDRTNLKPALFQEIRDKESNQIEICNPGGLCCITNAIWFVFKN